MTCECDCVSCTEFCDCQRCSKPETDLLSPPSNRPGLDGIRARIGDYGAFFSDARRQLSAKESPNLQALGTRDPTDPTIALLDVWSVTADVLTYYRERLTQEAYLRTATDEGSLRELASMVGFKPRPGIAATVHLAYLLDPSAKPVDIDPRAKAQTVPLPGEKMQTFETDEKLIARAEWSRMKPRQSRPSNIDWLYALTRRTLRLADPALFVRPGERVLFVFGRKLGYQVVREVLSAKIDIDMGFVEITLKPKHGLLQALTSQPKILTQLLDIRSIIVEKIKKFDPKKAADMKIIETGKRLLQVLSSYFLGTDATGALSFDLFQKSEIPDAFKEEMGDLNLIFTTIANPKLPQSKKLSPTSIDNILSGIRKSAAGDINSRASIAQQARVGLHADGVVRIELARVMVTEFQESLFPALRVSQANPLTDAPSVFLLKTLASPFGAVAPRKISSQDGAFMNEEWPLSSQDVKPGAAFLDTVVDGIAADSFAIVNSPTSSSWSGANQKQSEVDEVSSERLLRFAQVRSVQSLQRGSYQLSGKVTRLELVDSESGEPLPVVISELS